MTDNLLRDRIERELGKDRLHELDKPVFGGRQLSDKQIEGITDAVLAVLAELAEYGNQVESESYFVKTPHVSTLFGSKERAQKYAAILRSEGHSALVIRGVSTYRTEVVDDD